MLVQPEPYGDDHALVLDCLAREPERLRGTAFFYPKDPAAPQKLVALAWREPRIIAMRFHAHRGKEHYLDSFADPGSGRSGTGGRPRHDHRVAHRPELRRRCRRRARTYPRVPVLIDHLAEPQLGTPEEYEDVLALAAFDHVHMKLSGLGHFAKEAPLYEEALPLTRRVTDAFGPERIVWGSGSPQIIDTHLAHLSEAERDQVRGGISPGCSSSPDGVVSSARPGTRSMDTRGSDEGNNQDGGERDRDGVRGPGTPGAGRRSRSARPA